MNTAGYISRHGLRIDWQNKRDTYNQKFSNSRTPLRKIPCAKWRWSKLVNEKITCHFAANHTWMLISVTWKRGYARFAIEQGEEMTRNSSMVIKVDHKFTLPFFASSSDRTSRFVHIIRDQTSKVIYKQFTIQKINPASKFNQSMNIRIILLFYFSRFSPLRSTVKNGIDQLDEGEFPWQVKKRPSRHEVRYL